MDTNIVTYIQTNDRKVYKTDPEWEEICRKWMSNSKGTESWKYIVERIC